MIIAIDGYEANVEKRVGVSRYAFYIIKGLSSISKNQIVRIYLPEPPASDFPLENPSWKYMVRKPKKLWTYLGLPLSLTLDKPPAEVIFSPTHYIPRFTSIPRVMAIMDLSYLKFPELFKTKDLYQLVHWTRYSAHHAKKILTISEFSKHDIIDEYKIPSERVVVTYPGLSLHTAMGTSSSDKVKSKYNIGDTYILSVGTLQPRKNFVRLIEAFSQIRKRVATPKVQPQLVIVGKKGWLYDDILAAPARFGVDQHVRFLDFVPDEDLAMLYRGAVCFALPSLYEGFGLPVLEAMSNECSVVVSATSSLPEIAGSAGIYVNPESSKDIGKGLETAFRERGKAVARERIRKGLEQIKKFSWEKAARKTLEVLESVEKGNV